MYQIHYYVFDGNDVFDETNYKNEKVIRDSDFNEIMKVIEECFPGLIETRSSETRILVTKKAI